MPREQLMTSKMGKNNNKGCLRLSCGVCVCVCVQPCALRWFDQAHHRLAQGDRFAKCVYYM